MINHEEVDYAAARRALQIAAAVGYPVVDEMKLIDEAEEAARAAREAADEELQAQRERDAMDDKDERNGNSRGITRAILAERERRNQRRDMRKASPEIAEAFRQYDADKLTEQEASQRMRSKADITFPGSDTSAEDLDRSRRERAQRNRDEYFATRDSRREAMEKAIDAYRNRSR